MGRLKFKMAAPKRRRRQGLIAGLILPSAVRAELAAC